MGSEYEMLDKKKLTPFRTIYASQTKPVDFTETFDSPLLEYASNRIITSKVFS
jgi:hypothetical protein